MRAKLVTTLRISKHVGKLAGILLILPLTGCLWLRLCVDEVYVYLEVPTLEAGERVAIQKLSTAVSRCPTARRYEVFWKAVTAGEERGRRALIYKRHGNLIGYEDDPGSGFSSIVYVIADAAIHEVARRNGTFDDFAAHGRRAW